ncbi:DUF2732 domain-containing protein [Erwinia pyrifoliae]|uniref:DUF2732 domain-containing protein n=1 Tax=Erwinia pyrifoliae TaxID=79967 RepID=A0ABY5X422_ERWPY|nr:DUF2732 domain-containing protein [Erwinia pyrifoliae]MCT2388604.1 DUF2732 domain-containing protein [Erwinia pyrifoliae]MCU8586773.1 DUF2732 domain-containing protein [Erwinia pyrifoliae]UWS32126.1 DUF2732 domain-containing protein [Erwinia pyrifoliae]UXK13663.1 DUF2732 domain-containing protein [Erwinia pyrifoliae]
MKYIETKEIPASDDAVLMLLNKARNEQRKDGALSVSIRLEAIAIHAQKKEMNAAEIIDLLRKEAERFQHAAQELH